MKLHDWLKSTGIKRDEFAAIIGVSDASISRYITGDRVPRREVALKIREQTNGQVTPNDFIGDDFSEETSAA